MDAQILVAGRATLAQAADIYVLFAAAAREGVGFDVLLADSYRAGHHEVVRVVRPRRRFDLLLGHVRYVAPTRGTLDRLCGAVAAHNAAVREALEAEHPGRACDETLPHDDGSRFQKKSLVVLASPKRPREHGLVADLGSLIGTVHGYDHEGVDERTGLPCLRYAVDYDAPVYADGSTRAFACPSELALHAQPDREAPQARKRHAFVRA